jgi:amino-acid N-acetyltransferase
MTEETDMPARIDLATPSDLPAVLTLLNDSGLPEAGLTCGPGTLLLTAKDADRIVGCAALELYGEHALLRSVAVAEDQRGQGLGDRITEEALELAGRLRLSDVYLLTDSAERFFARHGFELTTREQVPAEVAEAEEFSTCCCSGAVTMVKRIDHRARRRFGAPGLALHDLAPTPDFSEPASCGCK